MFLCIDTVTVESGIALVDGDNAIDFLPLESRHSSEGIFMILDELFSRFSISDIQGVLVLRGPGSFTSVRVGIVVANQIAHQLKIPIVGLTTDQWYKFKTDCSDFFYLQSMNQEEIYGIGFGNLKFSNTVFPISELNLFSDAFWLGQLSSEHLKLLPLGFKPISDLSVTAQTWVQTCDAIFSSPLQSKLYDLVQPYYGKEPHITHSKKIV